MSLPPLKTAAAVAAAFLLCLGARPCAATTGSGSITMHASKRYFQDASGKPMFLLGYYCWASVAQGYYNESPQRYLDMVLKCSPYKINYIRVSLGINRLGGLKDGDIWDRMATPVPFKYVNGKYDLDQWDRDFWQGVRYQAALAKRYGVFIHFCIFDGVDIRGGDQRHRWINSFWNVKNQVKDYYGDLDLDHDGNCDVNGEFYRLEDFRNNTGVGNYQRKIIDKALAETAGYDNIFYEIGNEMLDSPADWNKAVVEYVRAKSGKAITMNGGNLTKTADGYSEHFPNTPADVKKTVAARVGKGLPFWEDPDGSRLGRATPDDMRRAIWYCFSGGAAGWGGFNGVFARTRGPRFSELTAQQYKHTADFIEQSGIRFWEMTPQHKLVSNDTINSCLANPGKEYMAYVLGDESIHLDLSGIAGKATSQLYNPKTGEWSDKEEIDGGASRTFSKPVGADDWVVYVRV